MCVAPDFVFVLRGVSAIESRTGSLENDFRVCTHTGRVTTVGASDGTSIAKLCTVVGGVESEFEGVLPKIIDTYVASCCSYA